MRLRKQLQRWAYLPIDIFEKIVGIRDNMTPPRGMIFIGQKKSFKEVGQVFKNYFIDLGLITPSSKILDVGCGIGRIAIPLTDYISADGSFDGFDIMKEDIDWCTKKITSKYPNFKFVWSNIYNKTYNPAGKQKSIDFKFPYIDNTFDFVFLTSVFTHMFEEDVAHYCSEISRVLKPGGKCFITYFLLNDWSNKTIASGDAVWKLPFAKGNIKYEFEQIPEDVIAYN